MRFPRAALLAAISDPATRVLVVEAPPGAGKSWLLRRACPPGSRHLAAKGLSAGLDTTCDAPCVVVDGAEQLDGEDVAALVDAIESTADTRQLIVAGRLLDDAVLDAAEMVDGLIVGAGRMMITPAEVIEAASLAEPTAEQLVELSSGIVRVLARVLDRLEAEPSADPLATALAVTRTTTNAALSKLDAHDAATLRLLARVVDVDRALIDEVAGVGFFERAVRAGVPFQREPSGGLSVVAPAAFTTGALDAGAAGTMATALVDRNRRLEAISLLLDAGDPTRAVEEFAGLPASIIETLDPRAAIALVSRFGAHADRHPSLLLLRAAAQARLGRRDRAWDDVKQARAVAAGMDPAVRRGVDVEVAELRLWQGHREEAIAIVERVLAEVQPGEERTHARACAVLAEATSTFNDREHLQIAADWFATAAAMWAASGEPARARSSRCDRVSAALVPLGRFDEALTELQQMLAAPDLSDSQRSWLVLIEGFSLLAAGREALAAERFDRAADLGQILDNPRIVATAAWGRALVAARRYDREATLHWMAVASNTGLGPPDDVLGVSYLCDMTVALGALGEAELAEDHLKRAHERPPLFPDVLDLTDFLTRARTGVVDDVDRALRWTPPAERWRTQLIGALGAARAGDHALARTLLSEAERELVSLGLGTFEALGERAALSELNELLQAQPAPATVVEASTRLLGAPTGRRLLVTGGSMRVVDRDGTHHIPAGNAQRLVGVVAAKNGAASIDALAESMWPAEDVSISRVRLRNVLMRLRRGAGNVLTRTGSGVRLAADVTCDLHDFLRRAADAQATARADPDLGGRLAAEAVGIVEGDVFSDFEYEEWAHGARHQVDQAMIGMLDLLSVQAEDSGDLAGAQHLAERALRLDRYTDSRYIRLAELLIMQGRTAAAAAVLEDASIAARERSPVVPEAFDARRRDLLRQVSES